MSCEDLKIEIVLFTNNTLFRKNDHVIIELKDNQIYKGEINQIDSVFLLIKLDIIETEISIYYEDMKYMDFQ